MEYKKFNPLNVSSKFAICGLPIRVDTYRTCTFGCKYCFANCRTGQIAITNVLEVGDVSKVERKLNNIFIKNSWVKSNLLNNLIYNGYTWHCGGMSDPFQPVENKLHITSDLINICNKFKIHILFSTKSDTLYNANVNPELHTFQLSVTNVYDRKDIEPNISNIDKRYEFFKYLKSQGFKVGIRVQPFIPNVTDIELFKMFKDADHFTIEGLKLIPTNKEQREYLMNLLGLSPNDFTHIGLLSLKPEKRLEIYKPIIEYLESNNLSYSISDNDLRYIGNNECCCGDSLINKSTTFNSTALIKKYGKGYTLAQVQHELEKSGCSQCKCANLFMSKDRHGCITVEDFYNRRFNIDNSPFSPKFLYKPIDNF